jgi:hypothetical protein
MRAGLRVHWEQGEPRSEDQGEERRPGSQFLLGKGPLWAGDPECRMVSSCRPRAVKDTSRSVLEVLSMCQQACRRGHSRALGAEGGAESNREVYEFYCHS